jgi:hypothetical protein
MCKKPVYTPKKKIVLRGGILLKYILHVSSNEVYTAFFNQMKYLLHFLSNEVYTGFLIQ